MSERTFRAPRLVGITGWASFSVTVLIGLGVDVWAIWFTPPGDTTFDQRLTIAAFVLLITAFIGAAVTGNACGRTKITANGLVTSTLLRRRSLPWLSITSFTVRDIGQRGSTQYALCADLGKPYQWRVLPGVMSFKEQDPDFLARIAEIQQVWTESTGRTVPEASASS